jgi:peroxidase
MPTEYRRIDGTGNNPLHDAWGAAGGAFLRRSGYHYADGVAAPAGADRPNPRAVSNEIFAQAGAVANEAGASNFLWVWGQFLDHDLDLARLQAGPGAERAPIAVPRGDPALDPFGTGAATIPLTRDAAAPGTGTGPGNPREHVNELTAWIDASMVYGSDAARAAALRAPDGTLLVSAGDMMPFNAAGMPNGNLPAGGPPAAALFLAGDVRANENPALAALHTVFVREHNRLVGELRARHPDWSAEKLYQEAKAFVEAEIQHITYDEFLPLLIGRDALPAYRGYDAAVHPGIDNLFAAALFRLGHTLLSPAIPRLGDDGQPAPGGAIALRDAFFRADLLADSRDLADILRGLAGSGAQALDGKVIDDVRNFLFGPPGAGGMDLVAINIQRGREHGLADYNTARAAYGLAKVASFAEITGDAVLAARLEALYGSVDKVDVFVGALVETDAPGAMVGPLLQAVLADQFARLRDGDRFWYENRFAADDLAAIKATTLGDIVARAGGIEHLQRDLFREYARQGGGDGHDELWGEDGRDLMAGGKGDDSLAGGGGDDQLHGDAGLDELFGGAGNDRLEGGDGHDYVEGGAGNDAIDGGAGDDELYGQRGDDAILAGDGGDLAWGGAGNDAIDGGAGDDEIWGGAGRDRLDGGAGDDTLAGGRGADTFVVGAPGGVDTIVDFDAGRGDRLDLSALGLAPERVLLRQDGADTVVTFAGQAGAVVLEGVDAATINVAQHFLL